MENVADMPISRTCKIVYLIETLGVGGAERQLVETAARINRDVFIPKVYCLVQGGPLQAIAEQSGLEVTIFDAGRSNLPRPYSSPFRRVRQFFALCRYLQQEQPDLVHCYMYKPSIFGGFAVQFLKKKPVLLTSRRCLGHFKDGKPYYQWLENIVNRSVDGVLVNSAAMKEDVLQRENLRADAVHILYNGVELEQYSLRFADKERSLRLTQKKQELGIPETAPVIGMVANLFSYKGYREFIMAASKVRRVFPETRFLCIGEDWGIQQELITQCSQLGLREHVLFTGHVQNIPEMLHILDIQVSASYEEGFSNAILEGMASGNPIVATAVGGTPEAILNNVTGILVPPKDPDMLAKAIVELLNAPDFSARLGQNARKRVEQHFSLEKMLDKLEKLYLRFVSL